MAYLNIDFDKRLGKIKPMHAVNNGPTCPTRMFSKTGNFDDYKAAGIPYARNHDAAFCANYGGEHTVDINAIFPNFDADPEDPASYDFACTDHYTKTILDAGTKVFYRLGSHFETVSERNDIYAVAAGDGNDRAIMITYFTNDTEKTSETLNIRQIGAPNGDYEVLLLDETHDAESVGTLSVENAEAELTVKPNTVVLLKST